MATATLDDPAHGEDAFRCIDSGYSSETAASSNDDGDEDDSADAGPGMCCIMPFVCVDPLGDWPALFLSSRPATQSISCRPARARNLSMLEVILG